ncbi:HesB/IscA family protein [Reinekea sp.]|jgi:iron-sulfur cluster assembly accessory protein|uniref:HesB/IscA family protein n=1 Tax=Reinekea sp. TaxID=1970455 RepID=UPI00398A0141
MTVQSFDPNNVSTANITITEKAIAHFDRQIANSDAKCVRLFIEESGCSGYMYRVDLVEQAKEGDIQIDVSTGWPLYVAADAVTILQGTEIDFKRDGLNEMVKFNNPNVTAECGCGESFVVEGSL